MYDVFEFLFWFFFSCVHIADIISWNDTNPLQCTMRFGITSGRKISERIFNKIISNWIGDQLIHKQASQADYMEWCSSSILRHNYANTRCLLTIMMMARKNHDFVLLYPGQYCTDCVSVWKLHMFYSWTISQTTIAMEREKIERKTITFDCRRKQGVCTMQGYHDKSVTSTSRQQKKVSRCGHQSLWSKG